MSEMAIPDDRAGIVPSDTSGSALVLWAYEARLAAQISTSLAKTSFVPASLRGKPEDIAAAILAGQELGLQPMATLRSMDVIQGTPALRAHAMRGLIQSHGHTVQLVESTKTRCVMRGRRKGEDHWQQVEWTVERAAELGLTGKSEWKKQQQTMLVARATGEICRLVASDVLYAMPYAAEELDDSEPLDAQPGSSGGAVTAQEILSRNTVTVEREFPPAPAPARAEPAPAQPRQADQDAEPASAGQLREMNILFTDAGITAHTGKGSTALNDEARFAWLAEHVGARVQSTKDLTTTQAAQAITLLGQAKVEAARSRTAMERRIAALFDSLDAPMSAEDRLRDLSKLLGRPVMGPAEISDTELGDIAGVLADCDGKAFAWDAALDAADQHHKQAANPNEPGL